MPRPVCRFDYLYRDTSNYKGCGSVLLWGGDGGKRGAIRSALIDGIYFEAERGSADPVPPGPGDAEPDEEEETWVA
ncbi:MAG: hypothetical protein IPP98_09270 [Gemmatimonadetes bacterium]|nr:hypothetical protein [Gemmatimonadota bacterium]